MKTRSATLALLGFWAMNASAFAGGPTIEINEVDSDQGFGVDGVEFIELYDGGGGSTSLDGLVVVLYDGATDTSYGAFDLDGFSTDANGFFVLGGSAVPNVDLVIGGTDVLVDASVAFGNWGAVALYSDDASDFPNGTPVALVNLADALVYGSGTLVDAGLTPLLILGVAVPDLFYGASASMGRCPDGAGLARDTRSYTAVTASPGAPSTCLDPMAFCNSSDGALAQCPCAPGFPDTGCDRPVPSMQGGGMTGGVRLERVAQATTPLNQATLTSAGIPIASTSAIVLMRASQLNPGGAVVFGDGLRCVGLPVVRIGSSVTFGGTAAHTFGHGAMAGSGLFYYQSWTRSTPVTFCDPTAAFTTSSGMSLNW